MQRRNIEWVILYLSNSANYIPHRPEDESSREKALQTVVAGNQAENLLDFDADEPTPNQPNSLSFDASNSNSNNLLSSQAIASVAKSTNPLDELMDLFSTAGMTAPAEPAVVNGTGAGMGMGMGMADLMSPVGTGTQSQQSQQSHPKGGAEEDLLGLL
jgi:AP-1 complex subunit beta-1